MTSKPPETKTLQTATRSAHPRLIQVLGPGLIAGASDDDPSGIATYSQAGAQFGYDLGWALLFSYPLMVAIQEISAQVGRVTGRGLAGNLRHHFPKSALYALVGLLCIANTLNLGADLGAMAAALKLMIGGPQYWYVLGFGVASVLLEIYVRYTRYVGALKWLTLSLLAYVAVVFVVDVPWEHLARSLLLPRLAWNTDVITAIVAILGTTISPYLFFWQAGQEVEDERQDPLAKPLLRAPEQAPFELERIRLDTYIGMAISNLIALFILLTTAATLHAHGLTDIQTSAQAAEALRPIAGDFAFFVFGAGIIGTGLLALPVLAGSAAYGVGEALHWPVGLARTLKHAKAFYGVIALSTLIGMVLNLTPIDPVKALFWCAVINGVVAVPIMIMTMVIASQARVMGRFRLRGPLKWMGWVATLVMAAAAVALVAV